MNTKNTESQSIARAPAVALVVVFGCAAQLSTEQLADATSRDCEAEVTGDLAEREAAMLAWIEASGRTVQERAHGRGYTVLPGRLLLPQGYATRPLTSRVASLEHEAVHVCRSGDRRVAWTLAYALDASVRLREEVAGIVAQGAEAYRQGRDGGELMRAKVEAMGERYHLRLDPQWVRDTLMPAMERAAREGER